MLVTKGAEQTLNNYELCQLAELFPYNNTSFYDYRRSVKFAYLYAKTLTLMSMFIKDEKTREIMCENRRLGLSNSGIAQFKEANGASTFIQWIDKAYSEVQRYDDVYSSWFDIPRSIKTTSVKPAGSISLLAGATPGCHYAMFEYYIRRIRIGEDSPVLPFLKKAGYHIEPDVYSMFTNVVSFPVYSGESKTEKDLSIWEQLELAALLQKYWADNSVSITVKFNRDRTSKQDIASALGYYQHKLKAVSFLPNIDNGEFPQMPYEEITKEQYEEMLANITPIDMSLLTNNTHDTDDMYCSNDVCEIPQR